ncbi:hypothetical protein MARPO_0016s0156 [Marchantia polymorpha]|uniref:Uncharacterized protein n=1 Tax=Marchantia polymorpha TaxID=3197 RepID=A0A2R6XG70_MARPO|nr:hypothetical protein MARPO_0016s0156 [Marchantia polymorpha]|eukprot:PTQ45112.1 hypothetical protein MARPO_0016s0156 [Marchantia polymorpha]
MTVTVPSPRRKTRSMLSIGFAAGNKLLQRSATRGLSFPTMLRIRSSCTGARHSWLFHATPSQGFLHSNFSTPIGIEAVTDVLTRYFCFPSLPSLPSHLRIQLRNVRRIDERTGIAQCNSPREERDGAGTKRVEWSGWWERKRSFRKQRREEGEERERGRKREREPEEYSHNPDLDSSTALCNRKQLG